MRGSPLIRFFLVFLALVVTAAGLWRVTAVKSNVAHTEETPVMTRSSAEIPYFLQLSSPAASVEISTGNFKTSKLTGALLLDPENPQIFLTVTWQTAPTSEELRFAKLTLEPVGQTTITHTFDAHGDIDDLLELPAFSGK